MQTVSTLSKSIYPTRKVDLACKVTERPTPATFQAAQPFHHFLSSPSCFFCPFLFLSASGPYFPCLPSFAPLLHLLDPFVSRLYRSFSRGRCAPPLLSARKAPLFICVKATPCGSRFQKPSKDPFPVRPALFSIAIHSAEVQARDSIPRRRRDVARELNLLARSIYLEKHGRVADFYTVVLFVELHVRRAIQHRSNYSPPLPVYTEAK